MRTVLAGNGVGRSSRTGEGHGSKVMAGGVRDGSNRMGCVYTCPQMDEPVRQGVKAWDLAPHHCHPVNPHSPTLNTHPRPLIHMPTNGRAATPGCQGVGHGTSARLLPPRRSIYPIPVYALHTPSLIRFVYLLVRLLVNALPLHVQEPSCPCMRDASHGLLAFVSRVPSSIHMSQKPSCCVMA